MLVSHERPCDSALKLVLWRNARLFLQTLPSGPGLCVLCSFTEKESFDNLARLTDVRIKIAFVNWLPATKSDVIEMVERGQSAANRFQPGTRIRRVHRVPRRQTQC